MRIRRLILENFGLFRGRTEIDLAPRERYKKIRPVVLVGGTNGSGKTTILDAIRLCLYGPLALGERVSQDDYHAYLRSSVHRDETALLPLHAATVGIEFEYGLAGRLHRFVVERGWECNGNTVITDLTVTRDGVPLDEIEQAHADDFLRDLIPRGVSQLFFFDGEKIQQMAQASDDDAALADAIKELLGLDLLSRLRSDLSVYVGRVRDADSPQAVNNQLSEIEKTIRELKEERLKLVRVSDQAHSRVDRIREEIARIEQRLSRGGGSFANERERLKAEEAQVKQAIDEAERQVRELCAELLPFTLARQLCTSLHDQLDAEKTLQDWQAHEELLQSQIGEIQQSLDEILFPTDDALRLTKNARQIITSRVRRMFDALAHTPDGLPDVPIVHRLSEGNRTRIVAAIQRILDEVPRQVKCLEATLEDHSRRLLQVKSGLERIPDDDVLEPLVKKLNNLHRNLGIAQAEAKRADESLRALDHQIDIQNRLTKKKQELLQNASKNSERRELVTRVQSVLDEYSVALTKTKVAELSKAVGDCFSQLWRKGDVLRQIKIDPETCSVILLDRHDCVVPKERLSAGEKQIYAISMLWALARVSRRVLPMVIDTPLARLDSKHRRHLVTRYFPHVSHQVVILSTDTEIDQTYFRELSPAVSHAYHLRYDDSEARTVVEEGYFWGRKELEAVT